ncbi:alpha/beta hydrolase [Nocardia sp. NPDC004722]
MTSAGAHLLSFAVRMLRVRRALDGEERILRTIATDRAKGPALPSKRIREGLSVREETIDGFRVFTLTPRDIRPTRRVLYLHGGGWVRPIMDPHWEMIAELAGLLGCSVTVPMYPLAPEHSAPDTFRWLLSLYAGLAPDGDLTVMGDSAGGHLTLSLAMQARDRGLPQPGALVLLSPLLDATLSDPAIAALDRMDPIVPARGVPILTRMFAGAVDLRDPMISPLFGTLTGLPPIALFVGTREIVNADAHRLRRLAAESDFPLSWHEYSGMLHVWPLFPIREGLRARREIAEFVRANTSPASAGD